MKCVPKIKQGFSKRPNVLNYYSEFNKDSDIPDSKVPKKGVTYHV